MQIDEYSVAVDTDFVNHMVETKISDEEICRYWKLALDELSLTAIVHPMVLQHEFMLPLSASVQKLFDEHVVSKVDFTDIFQGDREKEAYYIFLVKELYFHLKSISYPIPEQRILIEWKRKQSLGEIHSVAMCLVCGCGLFLSDDNDSKHLRRIIEQNMLGVIEVYSREEFFEHHSKNSSVRIPRKVRRSLTHSI